MSDYPADTGATAEEVLGGIGSILGAIAGPLSQIFISHQNTQLQLEQIKAGGLFPPPQPQFVPGMQASAARRGNSTAIIAIVVGVLALGAMFMFMKGKKD